jgi:hypothetical protein
MKGRNMADLKVKVSTPACPECEKLRAIAPVSQKVGEFIEWLQTDKSIVFCKAVDDSDYDSDETYVPFSINIQSVLAEFFGIDMDKVERERSALLESLRS